MLRGVEAGRQLDLERGVIWTPLGSMDVAVAPVLLLVVTLQV